MSIDGIINEPTVNFVGKDGFFWWVGEVEDNQDPMGLGRVKVRVLGYYTNVRGGTTTDLPKDHLPWATVLQHTSQPGNDGQGDSSGQLQPGAIVMGFFMDGEDAQMPIVIGVMRVKKSGQTSATQKFAFTGEEIQPGIAPNIASLPPGESNTMKKGSFRRSGDTNTVALPGKGTAAAPTAGDTSSSSSAKTTARTGGTGSPSNLGNSPGVAGSSSNPNKPREPRKPIPSANGVGGPWKVLEYKLSYLLEDIADSAANLVKAENGDFLDVVSGKIVKAQELTAKLQNFLGAVFTQVVAAIRQSLSNLAEELELVNLLGGATGAPYIIFTAIQSAVTTILQALCNIDRQIIGYIQDPIGSVLGFVNSFLDSAIDKASMVLQSIQSVIDNIVCNVQSLLGDVLKIVDTVSTIVKGVKQAQEIIDAWKAGSGIYSTATDLVKKSADAIKSISSLIALFIKFAASGCNRQAKGGEDTVGWYPLYGVTHCTPEELAEFDKLRGSNRGSCGNNGGGGSLLDSIFKEADPYLTAAKTFLDGSYEMYVGTPGRRASVKRDAAGNVETSINTNEEEFAEYKARKAFREKNPNATQEEEDKQVADHVKKATNNKGNTGSFVATHKSYNGNKTQEVHGDDCKLVDGDFDRTIDNDFRLNVTGDFHLVVGGGFFVTATGSPKVVDKNGKKKDEAVQKHTMCFHSDLDINCSGAKFEVQGAECNLASISTKVTGSLFENSASQQSYSGAELILSGSNSIEMNAPSLYNFINVPAIMPVVKAGIVNLVGGSVDTILTPGASSDAIPRYTVVNAAGPISMTCGATGYNLNVLTGALNANVAAGLINMNASAAVTLQAGGVMNLTAGGVMTLKAPTIFLN